MKMSCTTAIVTGGGGAIGKAIALRLADEGVSIAVADFDLATATETCALLKAKGVQSVAIQVDVRDAASTQRLADAALQALGRIDILVNCAGGSARERMTLFHESVPATTDWVIDVNLRGVLNSIRSAIGPMIEQKRGRIVNIASIIGLQGKQRCVDYAAAKGGVIALSKSLALEVGRHGITVNCVSPGQVPRGAVDPGFGERHSCLGTVCAPADVAGIVAFLCSDEAGYITGQNHVVDGGRSLGLKGD